MSDFIATAYFESKEKAYEYFEKEGTSKEAVLEYINEGLIHIGVPKVSNEFDLCLGTDGRYWRK